jgi:branched-chain amino acid transport system permease protein
MTELMDVILGGTFHAAVLFLVAAGLQLVFGVQKIVNLACGSFYALGAYFGITAVGLAIKLGMPVGLSSLVIQLQVFFTIGLAIAFLGDKLQRHNLIGAAIAGAVYAFLLGHDETPVPLSEATEA